jgi:thiamine kinase-like enzyme
VIVSLIDFEYGGYSYRGFDLGNALCEMYFDYDNPHPPGYFMRDERFPDARKRRRFAAAYAREWEAHRTAAQPAAPSSSSSAAAGQVPAGEPTAEDVDGLCSEAVVFMAASHLLWSLWGLVQAAHSDIAFGYAEYARDRIAHYLRIKRMIQPDDQRTATATAAAPATAAVVKQQIATK